MAYRTSSFGSGFGFGFSLTPWVKRLLIANAAVFLLTWLLPIWQWLAFAPSQVLLRPWTVVTYMFVHGGFWHLFFNMLALFFFGPPLEARWGSREFLKYYLISGLGGAGLSFIFAPHSAVVGASAAVYGVMLAFAMNWPDSPIYIWGIFPIKAKWLVAVLAGLSLFSAVGGGQDGIAHFAHLGGFAAGFLYLRFSDVPGARLARLKNKLARVSRKPRLIVVSNDESEGAHRRRTAAEEERLLDEVDRVLDKISSSGMSSLTAEERRILDEVSQRYRKN